jgi:hypothetical protein
MKLRGGGAPPIDPRDLGGTLCRTITDDDFDVPTTIARLGRSLYLPNARFGTTPTPTTEYWITRVDARGGR